MCIGAFVGLHAIQLAGHSTAVRAAARRETRQCDVRAVQIGATPARHRRRAFRKEDARAGYTEWGIAHAAWRDVARHCRALFDLLDDVLPREVFTEEFEAA